MSRASGSAWYPVVGRRPLYNPYEAPSCQDVAGKPTFRHLALRPRAPQTPRAVSGREVWPQTRLPPA
jgi:hypothetical protein